MPKLKTHKGAQKRFKVTGSGKIKRRQASKRHLLSHKSAKRKRQLRSTVTTTTKQAKKYIPMI